jgi:ParB/RepB/Spo0J family partition protein
MPTVTTKPVDFFHPDPTNPRKEFPEAELLALGQSLLKVQLVPGIAREDGMIIDMERRWRAAKLVGKKTLDAYLLPMTVTPAEIKRMQLISALHRSDLKAYEKYLGYRSFLDAAPASSGKELAAEMDVSEGAVSMTLSLSRCCKAVQDAAAAGVIGLKDWYEMSQANEEQQAAMLAAKLGGASMDAIKKITRRNGNAAVKTAKVKCAMPSGVVVTLNKKGDGITLDDVIETLAELLKYAEKANDEGLDSKTFSAVLKDRAKAI